MLWADKIRVVKPYVPGEQSKNQNIIKLNANENPYPPSPEVKKAISEFDFDTLKKYPDANSMELKSALAENYNIKTENVFVGNGSDDVLALAFMSFFNSNKPILFPDITYSFYPVWCSLFNIPYENPALDDNFRIVLKDYEKENGGIIIPNPNAPTGIGENLSFIEELLQKNQDVIVIIDEAYVDFGCESAIPLIEKYNNLVVVQTFSKSRSLAGLRVGAAFASKELISILEAVKNSYNSYTLDSLALVGATASVKDKKYFEETIKKIINTRENAVCEFKKLGFKTYESKTNFLLVSHEKIHAKDIFLKLKEKDIFVRYFNSKRIDNCLRITIGTDEEMDKLFSALKEILA